MDFVKKEDERLSKHYAIDKEKQVLARTIKIAEEFGELSEQVLMHTSLQRKDKLENKSQEDLESEFADVMLTTLLLAESLNVDIGSALEKKIEKIKKRKY
jgi:NTP pyrophosphatase (non-canonical NTP hydrolase)